MHASPREKKAKAVSGHVQYLKIRAPNDVASLHDATAYSGPCKSQEIVPENLSHAYMSPRITACPCRVNRNLLGGQLCETRCISSADHETFARVQEL